MKYQANRDYKSDDVVMTPTELAEKLVNHFKPQGKGLEPCRGTGNIYQFLDNADWCEIADDIYFLFTINHLWTKARLRDIKHYGFGIAEICIFDTPKSFPQSGFQVGMVHIKRNYNDNVIKFTKLN